jgi:hypothetical protein
VSALGTACEGEELGGGVDEHEAPDNRDGMKRKSRSSEWLTFGRINQIIVFM